MKFQSSKNNTPVIQQTSTQKAFPLSAQQLSEHSLFPNVQYRKYTVVHSIHNLSLHLNSICKNYKIYNTYIILDATEINLDHTLETFWFETGEVMVQTCNWQHCSQLQTCRYLSTYASVQIFTTKCIFASNTGKLPHEGNDLFILFLHSLVGYSSHCTKPSLQGHKL